MGVTGNTELLASKAAIVSALVQKHLAFQAKLLGSVMDVTQFGAAKGAKSISFPKFGGFTVENRASGAAASLQNLTAAVDTLALDQRSTVAWLIDSMDELQSTVEVQSEYIKRASTGLANEVDTQIISLLENAGFDQGAATVVTEDIILDMREYLIKNHADKNALTFLVGPDNEKAMLKISNFIDASKYGSPNLPSGEIGRVFGVPVIVHAGVPVGEAYMYEKSAIAVGFQRVAKYGEVDSPLYGVGSKTAVLDMLWGKQVMQTDTLSSGVGKSALIAKMA
jgi:N4-gp56 family major capsid protein